MTSRIKIFFDGGLRPLPDGMEVCAVIRGRAYIEQRLGAGASLEAEWRALLHAARLAHSLGLKNIVFLGDCATTVAQADGKAKARAMTVNLEAFRALVGDDPHVRHIKRTQNLAGIALERLRAR